MQGDVLRQVIGLEYQVAALAAAPVTTLVVGWLTRQLAAHTRDRRTAACAARLVAWAEQAIPDKSARYAEVAALLSRRFPALSGEQVEVLIESEVLGLKAALRASAAPGSGAAGSAAGVGTGAAASLAPASMAAAGLVVASGVGTATGLASTSGVETAGMAPAAIAVAGAAAQPVGGEPALQAPLRVGTGS